MWSLRRTRHVISTGVAVVVLGVSVAGCGTGSVLNPVRSVQFPSGVICTIEHVEGDLVEQGGRTAISSSVWLSQSGWDGPLVWPDGWSLRTVDGDALEVVDPAGVVRARTGTRISIAAVSDDAHPMMTEG